MMKISVRMALRKVENRVLLPAATPGRRLGSVIGLKGLLRASGHHREIAVASLAGRRCGNDDSGYPNRKCRLACLERSPDCAAIGFAVLQDAGLK